MGCRGTGTTTLNLAPKLEAGGMADMGRHCPGCPLAARRARETIHMGLYHRALALSFDQRQHLFGDPAHLAELVGGADDDLKYVDAGIDIFV